MASQHMLLFSNATARCIIISFTGLTGFYTVVLYMDAANGVVFGTCASGCETCPLTPTVRRCICR